MQKLRTYALIFMSFFILVAPLSALAETAVVNTSTLKVRSGPGLSYDVIGTVTSGEQFDILTTENDWYQINDNGQIGWIASWLTTGLQTSTENQSAIIQVKKLNVRSSASQSASLLGQLQQGQSVSVLSIKGDWVEIPYNGSTAWISKEYIQLVSAEEQTTVDQSSLDTFVVQVDALNVRAEPSLDSERSAVINRNDTFKVLSTDTTWVEIELADGSSGWVYRFYGSFQAAAPTAQQADSTSEVVTILYNGTNLRSQPSTSGDVDARVDAGQKLTVVQTINDWYEVEFDGKSVFVANWVVTSADVDIVTTAVQEVEEPERKKGTLTGLDIVLDPGHGGNDPGTSGYYGTDEKKLTLPTAELLAAKLEAAGANVTLTRESDTYVSLRKRLSVSHQVGADAFISIHFDAVDDNSVHGFTTYYQYEFQKELADHIHSALADRLTLRDRGVREGNYLVLRENQQHAVLLELGYLSNATEERTLTTSQFRDTAAHAIYEGVISYFDNELE